MSIRPFFPCTWSKICRSEGRWSHRPLFLVTHFLPVLSIIKWGSVHVLIVPQRMESAEDYVFWGSDSLVSLQDYNYNKWIELVICLTVLCQVKELEPLSQAFIFYTGIIKTCEGIPFTFLTSNKYTCYSSWKFSISKPSKVKKMHSGCSRVYRMKTAFLSRNSHCVFSPVQLWLSFYTLLSDYKSVFMLYVWISKTIIHLVATTLFYFPKS